MILVLIFISLMISDVEHLFIYLLCRPFVCFLLRNSQVFSPFFNGIIFVLLSCINYIYILDTNPLWNI